MSEKYETPSRMTAHNDVTGALIKSKADNQDAFASGWDAIWGTKKSTSISKSEPREGDEYYE